MAHSRTYEAIVLRTYDIGEADRFCILLTKERGRLAARARGVRKLTSRMGGSLLPLNRMHIDLHEGCAGLLITGASNVLSAKPQSIAMFIQAQKGIELLLQLAEDDDPLPEIFALLEEFLNVCGAHNTDVILPFTVRLLFLLGLLPRVQKPSISVQESLQIEGYLRQCTTRDWQTQEQLSLRSTQAVEAACHEIITQHIRSALRVPAVAASMAL